MCICMYIYVYVYYPCCRGAAVGRAAPRAQVKDAELHEAKNQ